MVANIRDEERALCAGRLDVSGLEAGVGGSRDFAVSPLCGAGYPLER